METKDPAFSTLVQCPHHNERQSWICRDVHHTLYILYDAVEKRANSLASLKQLVTAIVEEVVD